MNFRNTIAGQAFSLAAATGAAQLLYALSFLLLARHTSVDTVGDVATAQASAIVLSGVIDFGTNSYWIRELSAGRINTQHVSRMSNGKALAAGAASCVLTLILWLTHNAAWTGGLLVLPLTMALNTQVIPRSIRRTAPVVLAVLFDKATLFSLTALFLVVARQDIAILSMVAVATGACVSVVVCRSATPVAYRMRTNMRPSFPWHGSSGYGISALAVNLQLIDLPILAALGGSTSAGVYGAVNRWTQPMILVAATFGAAATPFIARHQTIREAMPELRRAIWLPALAAFASLVAAILAPQIVHVLLGENFRDSGPTLRLLALGTVAVAVNQPAFVLLQATRRDRIAARLLLVSVAVQLFLTSVLARPYGATGAAFAYMSFQWLLLAMLAAAIVRALRHPHHDHS